jgi:flagellar biosynthesis protein FlhB
MVSMRSGVELIKSLLKVAIVGYVVYIFLRAEFPGMTKLSGLSPGAMGSAVGILCWRLVIRACAAMLIIAILDYMYQRLQFEQSIKMTKQEVKEEYKRSEGDPQVKGRIRQIQREMGKRRLAQDVAGAHVVITNPTQIAVAIKYDLENMEAPTVVAKGQRLLAQKIREIAEASGVPIVENKPIARLLYKVVEVGQQIPEELYQAVAEILAFVYRMGTKAGARYKATG